MLGSQSICTYSLSAIKMQFSQQDSWLTQPNALAKLQKIPPTSLFWLTDLNTQLAGSIFSQYPFPEPNLYETNTLIRKCWHNLFNYFRKKTRNSEISLQLLCSGFTTTCLPGLVTLHLTYSLAFMWTFRLKLKVVNRLTWPFQADPFSSKRILKLPGFHSTHNKQCPPPASSGSLHAVVFMCSWIWTERNSATHHNNYTCIAVKAITNE
jgi:hypothetical protein